MSVYAKVAKIKFELSQIEIKKSGYNSFQKFKYHELKDFLSHITRLNNEHGIDDTIEITQDGCHLTLTDVEDGSSKTTSITYEEAEMLAKGGKPSTTDAIQRLGATITYIRRYLYLVGYNIIDNDIVDSKDQNDNIVTEPVPPQLATKTQVKQIIELVGSDLDLGQKVLKQYNKLAYTNFTLNEASECIKLLKQAK